MVAPGVALVRASEPGPWPPVPTVNVLHAVDGPALVAVQVAAEDRGRAGLAQRRGSSASPDCSGRWQATKRTAGPGSRSAVRANATAAGSLGSSPRITTWIGP